MFAPKMVIFNFSLFLDSKFFALAQRASDARRRSRPRQLSRNQAAVFRRLSIAMMKISILSLTQTTSRRTVTLTCRYIATLGQETRPRRDDLLVHSCHAFQKRMVYRGNMQSFTLDMGSILSHCILRGLRSFSTQAKVQDPEVHFDLFGEPVTFIGGEGVDTAMAAMDEFVVAVISKGNTCSDGGDEEGLSTQAAHSAAIVWAELLRHAAMWHASSPMLAVAAVGPLLAQASVGYLRTVDSLLKQVDSGVSVPVSMLGIATTAASMKDDERLTTREQRHLEALHHMLRHERRQAMVILLRLLQQAPGDALALSLCIDLANTIGDGSSAMRAAGFVASYWQERGERGLRFSMPGYALVLSWIALGLAAGGRFPEAERLAERAMSQDAKSCGGVATWALAHVYDAEGRTAEAISRLTGDFAFHYETSGLLFFDGRLRSYGARFTLDREGLGEGRSALRVYDSNFDRVLQYSGYAYKRPWGKPQRRAPKTSSLVESAEQSAKSFFGRVFGGKDNESKPDDKETDEPAANSPIQDLLTLEDVLSWMPPTPQLLLDATLLLLRLTLNDSVRADDRRWKELSNAWDVLLTLDRLHVSDRDQGSDSGNLAPLVAATASLVCPSTAFPQTRGHAMQLSKALSLFGELLRSGSLHDDARPTEKEKETWISITKELSQAITCVDKFDSWDMDLRPILHQIICHAACKSNDHESLCLARSICSEGVFLRPNCPEEWFRYSVVLKQLEDDVAAEDARAASISLGSGEGGYRTR